MLERWRPARAGLINVWRYLEETFEFHGGRLLLRGPNGSGKSMALELLFPFLLDARALPTRLSSAAKSRGGLYDRIMTGSDHPDRTGYAWAEFVRDGQAFTVGVRLRASTASAKATSDWFTTSRRVGHDLLLLDENRSALSKKQLAEVLGEDGHLYASADDYRNAVRQRLFPGYTEKQYDAVISALLALRKEKVSQDLTPARLSEILTASLPPVDEHDIAEIAEGFEKLDRRRDELAALERDRDQVRKLLARQRAYARAVLLAEANSVRAAETNRDNVTKDERRAREDLEHANEEAAEIVDKQRTGIQRTEAIAAEIDTLKNLDAYRQGAALEPLRDELRRSENLARDAASAVTRRTEAEVHARTELTRRREEAETARGNLESSRAELNVAADGIGAEATVDRAAGESTFDVGDSLLEAWCDSRRRQLEEVHAAAQNHAEAVTTRRFREERLDEDRAVHDGAVEQRFGIEAALEATRLAYSEAVRTWVSECRTLQFELPVAASDPHVVRRALEQRASAIRSSFAVRRADLERRRADREVERDSLEAERSELVAGREIEPEAPGWRTPRGESATPLWRLVDFRDDCEEQVRGGIEVALLASGILDALVMPDGRFAGQDADVVLASGTLLEGRTLADVLVPVEETSVSTDVISRILRSVRLQESSPAFNAGPASTAVGPDGGFKIALLEGRANVEPARFIGAAARERERAQRIAALNEALVMLMRDEAAIRAQIDATEREENALDAEVEATPDGTHVLEGVLALERALADVESCSARVQSSESALHEAEALVRNAQRQLAALAARYELPTDDQALAEQARALDRFKRIADAWMTRRRQLDRAGDERERATERCEERAADLREAQNTLESHERHARELKSRLDALEQTVGSDFQEIVARLSALSDERRSLEERRHVLESKRVELAGRVGKLDEQLTQASRERERAEAERDAAHRRFVACVVDGIGRDADHEVDAGALGAGLSAVLDAARATAQRFSDVTADQQAIQRLHTHVVEMIHLCRQTISARVDLSHEQSVAGWWLLRTLAGGIRRPVGEYAASLDQDLSAARTELKDEEHRLFDETLSGSVRAAVAERIRRSRDLVDRMNEELSRVRTHAAGVQVRLRWDVDPEQPDAVRSARRLLLKDPADLVDSEREALYGFFRARIEQVRTEVETATGWEERLRAVLDYRVWHRFTLELAHRDWDGYLAATSARLQRLSTGERSLALHLPMLASIGAHYAAGTNGHEAGCPRLILLDELFAGVDTANRAQLFELLVTWDLDAVLTSDHEWCAYSTLDAIAIHHLHADGDEPVTSSRFMWDGRRRLPAPVAG